MTLKYWLDKLENIIHDPQYANMRNIGNKYFFDYIGKAQADTTSPLVLIFSSMYQYIGDEDFTYGIKMNFYDKKQIIENFCYIPRWDNIELVISRPPSPGKILFDQLSIGDKVGLSLFHNDVMPVDWQEIDPAVLLGAEVFYEDHPKSELCVALDMISSDNAVDTQTNLLWDGDYGDPVQLECFLFNEISSYHALRKYYEIYGNG